MSIVRRECGWGKGRSAVEAAEARRIGTTRRSLLAAGAVLAVRPAAAAEPLRVAAAADLRHALDEIARAFEAAGGGPVVITYGSSGLLARQIAQGAPFELFLAADEEFTNRLATEGHAEGTGTRYATGRLALITPRRAMPEGSSGFDGLARMLDTGLIRRFAIANPEHAPYGARSREALERVDLWPRLAGRLVLAENVAQAAQFVVTGAAQAGITAYALMQGEGRGLNLEQAVIAATLHTPLRQTMILTRRAGPIARRLHDFVAGAGGQAILARYGFEKP